MASFSRDTDGIDHINIYSKGITELGRLLSNFAHTPVTVPNDGKFNSIEGYWYWLLAVNKPDKDRLRTVSGFEAKALGREIVAKDWPEVNDEFFKFKIYQALIAKVIQTRGLEEKIVNSNLPFAHYYVYNNRTVNVEEGQWFIEAWEQIRQDLKDRR